MAADPDRIEAVRQTGVAQVGKVLVEVAERVASGYRRNGDLLLNAEPAEVAISEANLGKLCEELIDNAFKFSTGGQRVEVKSRITDDKVWLSIADEGQGIAAEIVRGLRDAGQFERIFCEKGGAALGLAIAVRLAELHEGRALIQSQPGTGTSIMIELPLAKAPAS